MLASAQAFEDAGMAIVIAPVNVRLNDHECIAFTAVGSGRTFVCAVDDGPWIATRAAEISRTGVLARHQPYHGGAD
jgi:hypothetical protein